MARQIPPDAGVYAGDLEAIVNRFDPARGTYYGIDVGFGWYAIVATLNLMIARLAPDYEVTQIKQKFGTLRYYVRVPDEVSDQVDELITEAEKLSAVTCEICGAPGELSNKLGGVKVTCKDHEDNWRELVYAKWEENNKK